MKIATSLVVGLVMVCGSALADGGPQPVESIRKIDVDRAAKAVLQPDGSVKRVGDWIDGPFTSGPSCTDLTVDDLCFDAFGLDENGEFGDCGDCDECFFFRPPQFNYCTSTVVDNFTVASGDEGRPAARIEFAWIQGVEEDFIVALFTAEDFDATCQGPPFGNPLEGVMFLFRDVSGQSGFFTDICLANLGLTLPLPTDGEGAYIFKYMTDDGQGGTKMSTCNSPIFSGVNIPGQPSEGSQGPMAWIDDSDQKEGTCECTDKDGDGNCDNLPDGKITAPCECQDLSTGECVDPLGVTFAIYCERSSCPQNKEQIKKIKLKNGQCDKISVVTKGAQRDCQQFVAVTLDTGQRIRRPVKPNGKAKVRFRNVPSGGRDAVAEWESGATDSKNFFCSE